MPYQSYLHAFLFLLTMVFALILLIDPVKLGFFIPRWRSKHNNGRRLWDVKDYSHLRET